MGSQLLETHSVLKFCHLLLQVFYINIRQERENQKHFKVFSEQKNNCLYVTLTSSLSINTMVTKNMTLVSMRHLKKASCATRSCALVFTRWLIS